jgi:hypothetical protein
LLLQEGGNIQDHVREFQDVFNRLELLCISFAEDVKASFLLA